MRSIRSIFGSIAPLAVLLAAVPIGCNYPKHICWVDKCGSATCGSCPGPFKDWAGNLVFKSWCSYLCQEPVAYGKTVAVGVMGVTAWGSTLPLNGPYCFDP